MTTKRLHRIASFVALSAVMALAHAAYATDMGAQGSGAAAEAQVGTGGAAANAQVGTPGAAPGTDTQVDIKARAGSPITGALTVKDPTLRTFTIQGQPQVYVAPETVDIKTLEGEDVTVTFDANGRVTTIEIDREG